MSHKELKARVRAEALEEALLDEEQEARVRKRLNNWKLATVILGILLFATVAGVVPFPCWPSFS
jgi:hypothetical protein